MSLECNIHCNHIS